MVDCKEGIKKIEGEISEVCNTINSTASRLDEALNILSDRLMPILGFDPKIIKCANSSVSTSTSRESELAIKLQDYAYKIEYSFLMVDTIIDAIRL